MWRKYLCIFLLGLCREPVQNAISWGICQSCEFLLHDFVIDYIRSKDCIWSKLLSSLVVACLFVGLGMQGDDIIWAVSSVSTRFCLAMDTDFVQEQVPSLEKIKEFALNYNVGVVGVFRSAGLDQRSKFTRFTSWGSSMAWRVLKISLKHWKQ